MCDLVVSWAGVSSEVLRVVGNAVGADCSDIQVSLSIIAPPEELTTNATWMSPNRWQALFALTAAQRQSICADPPRYRLTVSCPTCTADVSYANVLECCPFIAPEPWSVDPNCEDPGQLGVLQRVLRLSFTVTRRNAHGELPFLVSVTGDGGFRRESRHSMPVEAPDTTTGLAQETAAFQTAFLVPPGGPLRLTYQVLERSECKASIVSVDVPALDPCTCAGHPPSTGSFTVTDDLTGANLTEAVAAGRCVSATRVLIAAPSDARAGRFEWLAPATPTAADPFATVAEVPDTDEGVTVTARIGSRPCETDRAVTVLRCQSRPSYCSRLPVPCWLLEAWGLIFFFLSLVFGHVGSILLGAVAAKSINTAAVKAISDAFAAIPVLGAAVTAAGNAYSVVSAVVGAWAATVGLIIFAVGCIGLVIALVCLWLWVTCCAPRNWGCRFYQNLHAIISLFAMTTPLWILLGAAVCAVFGMAFESFFGVGYGTIFICAITSILFGIVTFVMWLSKCPFINPFVLLFGRRP